ncbi:MAG: hypothetical protein Q8N47_28325, partial [Bryobacterales bacterium]|nr:hypothetical protein [Bryobacterales bacterium]
GAAEMHWLPSMTYQDPRRMSLPRPVGSRYQGMLVYPLMLPEAYLTQFAFPRNRPQTTNLKVQGRRELPDLVERYQRAAPSMPGLGTFRYGAVALTVSYDQNGRPYREKLVTVIEDTGSLGVGMWSNKDTLMVRAPAADFDRMAPLFAMVQASIRLNPAWLDGERRGSAQRAVNARATQQYIQPRSSEIVENRRRANAEIAHSMFNPHTGEPEYGSNQYRHRWQSANGT